MDRTTELELLDELLALKTNKTFYLEEETSKSPVSRYMSQDHFDREHQALFRNLPQMLAHSSELPDPGSFLRRDLAGLPLLITRDKDGDVHAFLNVCRHRGTQLVSEDSGCKHRFSCPYHAWTWNSGGELLAIPHQEQGFPGIDKSTLGLKALPCAERFGFIWVHPNADVKLDLDQYLGPITSDLDWLQAGTLDVFAVEDKTFDVNWKILIEGGIESYHFKIAHKNTIGPYFQDNLSSYQMFGDHMRSILPRTALDDLPNQPRETWDIRTQTNIIYSIFPTSQFLVQSDHIVWIQMLPISANQTRLRLHTLAPKPSGGDFDMPASHWKKNHEITLMTLTEDFEIGESIQRGLSSGANDALIFGRYEGALESFNHVIDKHIAQNAS